MSVKNSGVIDKIKKIKGIEFIVAGLIGLILVLVLTSDSIFEPKEQTGNTTEYVTLLEKRLQKTLSNVDKAGKVSVAITVKGGNRTVVAMDVSTVKDGNQMQITETPCLVGGKVVVLAEEYPEIVGVIIVASGAEDFSVKLSLIEATTTLLDIEETKVSVLIGK